MARIEKRSAPRFVVAVSAEVYTKQKVLPANTRNLSSSGVCVDLGEALEEGKTVGISLFLTHDGIEDPDVPALNLKASIIWCSEREDSGFSAGARFEDLKPEQVSRLGRFLATLA